jgi:hypothetical protein
MVIRNSKQIFTSPFQQTFRRITLHKFLNYLQTIYSYILLDDLDKLVLFYKLQVYFILRIQNYMFFKSSQNNQTNIYVISESYQRPNVLNY